MQYSPINDSNRQQYVDWLNNLATDLNGQEEDPNRKDIFPGSDNGDIATVKDVVGGFLATLTNQNVTIQ